MIPANLGFEAALELYREGRLEEALRAIDAQLAREPGSAALRSLRGLTRCQLGGFDAGIADLREAVAMAPRDASLHANLGMILLVLNRLDQANAALRRALVLVPNHPEALANLGLVLSAQGDFAAAERAARAALAARSRFPQALLNLGYVLLAQGKFAEAWDSICARPNDRVNLRDPHLPVAVAHDTALPAATMPIIIHGEQGLGDALFYLRFVPALRRRGHRLGFWGDSRLHPLVSRTGLFEHCLKPEALPAAGLTVLWAGDLPRLLGAVDAATFPRALALKPDATRRNALSAQLARWGPPPYVGLTWRAGLERDGKIALAKNIDLALLGTALARLPATFVSVQRNARQEELQGVAGALGMPLYDAGFVNDDLDDALAMMDLLDEYVAVSNTNVHLRAGAGRNARVLVPFPPEWRWLEGPGRSPWFADLEVYRQSRGGDWDTALGRLRADLAARLERD